MMPPPPPACDESDLADADALDACAIATIAKALAHPARVRIIERFGDHVPRTAKDIVADCELAQSTVSEHLRVLREANVVFTRHDGRWVWYCLRRSVLTEFAHATVGLTEDWDEPAAG